MAKRLYVGNLAFSVTSDDLKAMFAAHGSVQAAQVQVDRETGKSRGFGFVLMGEDAEAEEAIARIDGTECQGRRLNVNEAQAKIPPQGVGPGRFGRGPGGPDRFERGLSRFEGGPGRPGRGPVGPGRPRRGPARPGPVERRPGPFAGRLDRGGRTEPGAGEGS